MTSPSERQKLLAELNTLAVRDLVGVWRRALVADVDFAKFLLDAFPQIATTYSDLAADIAVRWYDTDTPQGQIYQARPVEPPPLVALQQSTAWALGATGDAALSRLAGTLQRTVFSGARDTIVANASIEPGSRWARHASVNACGFCRLLATRHVGENATFYRSAESAGEVVGRSIDLTAADRQAVAAGTMTREEALARRANYENAKAAERSGRRVGDSKIRRPRGNGKLGDKYHDHCHCISVEIRPGSDYTPPPYVEQWNDDYLAARKVVGGDPAKLSAAMDPRRHTHE